MKWILLLLAAIVIFTIGCSPPPGELKQNGNNFSASLATRNGMISAETIDVYPARVKYRGFDAERVSVAYEKIARYMVENADDLLEEAKE